MVNDMAFYDYDESFESEIYWGLVVVSLQVLFFPLYFLALTYFYVLPLVDNGAFTLPFLDRDLVKGLILFGTVIVFPLPYVLWSVKQRYQLADAYEHMGSRIWKLPITIKIFYGINSLVVLMFLIPLISPLLSMLTGFIFGALLSKSREKKYFSKMSLIIGLLYLPIPALVAWAFYSGIVPAFGTLIELWRSNLEFMYISTILLADSVTFGGVVYLIYEGAREVDPSVQVPEIPITISVIVLYAIMEGFLIAYPGSFGEFLIFVHWFAIIVGIVTIGVRLWRGLSPTRGATSISGWVTLIFFQALNLITNYVSKFIPDVDFSFAKSLAIFVAFFVFMVMFIGSYYRATTRF